MSDETADNTSPGQDADRTSSSFDGIDLSSGGQDADQTRLDDAVMGTVAQDFPAIEGFQITGRLGEGGMGTVYRAIQLGNKRAVAIKLMSARTLGSDKAKRRFEREVELASSLDHPHIARVYETGVHKGVYYYAMPLVEGLPLDRHVSAQDLNTKQIVALMQKVCEAVDYAHRRGVIHRDLKPSNILVTAEGEPMVLDFGLAKSLVEDPESLSLSREGDLAGTPAFMSPEQAAGHVKEIDTRSDVYALGVILYRLLTGESPHEMVGSTYSIMRRIVEDEPRSPRSLTPGIDRDLEAILLKCLAKGPAERYGAAGSMAEDLERFLQGEPITAQPTTITYFLRKRLRKHKPAVAATLAAMLAVVGGVSFYIWSINAERRRTEEARAEAVENATTAARNAERARLATVLAQRREAINRAQLVRTYVDRAWELMDQADHPGALLLHAQAMRLDAEADQEIKAVQLDPHEPAAPVDLAGHRFRYGQTLGLVEQIPVIVHHPAPLQGAKFQPGGMRFVTQCSDGTARVWDSSTGQPTSAVMRHEGEIYSVEFSKDGKLLATASADGSARVWDAMTGEPITPPLMHVKYETQKMKVSQVTFDPEAKRLLTAADGGQARLWDARTGELLIGPIDADDRSNSLVRFCRFSPDGSQFFTLTQGSQMRIWDAKTGAPRTDFFGIKESPRYAGYSPDGSRIVTTGLYGLAQQWDAMTGEAFGAEMQQPPFGKIGIGNADYRHDGKVIVTSGASDHCARFWDADTGNPLPDLTIQMDSSVWQARFNPEGKHVVVACEDGTARVFGVFGDKPVPTSPVYQHGGAVRYASFSDDGYRVLTASMDGTARVYRQTSQTGLFIALKHDGGVAHAAISPDSTLLATGGEANTVWLWDLDTGRQLPDLLTLPDTIHDLAFRPDGRQLLITYGKPNFVSGNHTLWNRGDDGSWSAVHLDASMRGQARYLGADQIVSRGSSSATIVNANTLEVLHRHPIAANPFRGFDVHADTRQVITPHQNTAMIWDATTGQTRAVLEHPIEVTDVAFSPDGRLAATTAKDAVLRIWDAQTGQSVGEPIANPVNSSSLRNVRFSPDSTMVAVNIGDGSIRVFDPRTSQPLTPPLPLEVHVCNVLFTPDNRFVIGISDKGWARVFEARGGLPSSPKLWYLRSDLGCDMTISPDGQHLVMVGGTFQSTLWKLDKLMGKDWPVQDAFAMAQVISRRTLDATGNIVSLPHNQWQQLRDTYSTRYPTLFHEIHPSASNADSSSSRANLP